MLDIGNGGDGTWLTTRNTSLGVRSVQRIVMITRRPTDKQQATILTPPTG